MVIVIVTEYVQLIFDGSIQCTSVRKYFCERILTMEYGEFLW